MFYANCYTECFYVRSHYVVHCCADYCYAGCRYTYFSHTKYHNLASMLPIVILTINALCRNLDRMITIVILIIISFVPQLSQHIDYCYADYQSTDSRCAECYFIECKDTECRYTERD